MSLSSFAELAAKFAVMKSVVDHGMEGAMEKACVLIEEEAKDAIGTYRYGWPQLAESTQAERVAAGFSANEPLLRTGELKDSIQHNVESAKVGYVGTDDPIGKYQEFGTSKIPPRPFLGGAIEAKGQEAAELFGVSVHDAITGKSAP